MIEREMPELVAVAADLVEIIDREPPSDALRLQALEMAKRVNSRLHDLAAGKRESSPEGEALMANGRRLVAYVGQGAPDYLRMTLGS